MAKVKWRGGTLLSPVPPAMVTCSHGGKDNIITIAWTGIINSDPPKTYISVRPKRYSHALIKESGVFAINLTTKALAHSADWCGVYTGAKVDKFEKCRLTAERAEGVSAPAIAECPVSIECRVCEVLSLGSHDMFIADVLAVHVDPEMMNGDSIDFSKISTIAYGNSAYFKVEQKLGGFGIWKQL